MKNPEKQKSEPTEKENVEKWVTEYQPRLKSFIRKRVSNKEDAEDILQDVFYQLAKTVESTFHPIDQIAAWLYRVARNTIINKGKKKQEEQLFISQDDDDDNILRDFSGLLFDNNDIAPSPETEYMRSLVWEELEIALSELPPEQKEVFELTELD